MSDATFEQRLAIVERYQQNHGNTLSAHSDTLTQIKIDTGRREERDKGIDGRLDRIERTMNANFSGIYKLGWWILAAFGSSFIALLANFIWRGGFNI